MAERRMFTKKVTDDDHFMSLSSSAQALYLHLMMSADDDGFSNQVTIAMFRAHASVQDLQALLESRYVYQFDDGVIVITHWRMANALRKDRYSPTVYQKELASLKLDEKGVYQPVQGAWLPDGCQMVAERLPQDRLGKDRVGKDRTGKENTKAQKAPSVSDLIEDFTIDEDVKQALKDFCEMRRSIKKPITARGMTGILKKLKELSPRPDIQVKILEQSIEHDWQTVYELKTDKPKEDPNGLNVISEWLAGREDHESS